jgi:1-phosphofructokinase
MAESPGVCVFAPAPVLTVMIESGSDEQPDVHVHAGGQGPWIANMLDVLEVRTVLCAPLGGETGQVLAAVLRGDGLELRSVDARGNGCQVEDRRSGQPECIADMPSPALNRHQVDELCNQTLAAGVETGVVVLTGSSSAGVLEPDVFRRIAADLSELGVCVVADLSGDALSAALDGGVSVLKISDEDLGDTDPASTIDDLRARVSDLVVLTRGSAPALAAIGADEVAEVNVPTLQVVDHRGAGDSMTAGIAARLARGHDLRDAVRLGAAAGATNATRHGLASGRRETIEAVAEKVTIRKASEEIRRARSHHQ